MKYKLHSFLKISVLLILFISLVNIQKINAQDSIDTLEGRNIYRPNLQMQDTSLNTIEEEQREVFIKDSIEIRLKFVKDSIEEREKFVRDSLLVRQRKLDSLNFLKAELPRLLDASLRIGTDEFKIFTDKITLVGDSVLGTYNWIILPLALDKPFVPWKSGINLADKNIKIITDKSINKISSVQTPVFNYSFVYGNINILRINEESTVISNQSGKFFKSPFDSVFFDREGRIIKLKRYIQLNQVLANYQKGNIILTYLSQVKQYEYRYDNLISGYHVTNFCDRWRVSDASKVCNIVNYSLIQKNNSYQLTRKNDPANVFSDGTFTFEFENNFILKSVAFNNQSKSEDWKCFIELNDAGNVSCYTYQNKGEVHRSLLVNYYLNDPKAKYKVETITCTFEDDGVSYFQKNNTTGLSRTRDQETGEWSNWK